MKQPFYKNLYYPAVSAAIFYALMFAAQDLFHMNKKVVNTLAALGVLCLAWYVGLFVIEQVIQWREKVKQIIERRKKK